MRHVFVVNEPLDEAHNERLQRVRHVRLALALVDALQVGLLLCLHRVRHEVVLPSMTTGEVKWALRKQRAAHA